MASRCHRVVSPTTLARFVATRTVSWARLSSATKRVAPSLSCRPPVLPLLASHARVSFASRPASTIPTDRCAGIVMNYNNPNDFFVASICRQSSSPPSRRVRVCANTTMASGTRFTSRPAAADARLCSSPTAFGSTSSGRRPTALNTFVISLANASPQRSCRRSRSVRQRHRATQWTSRTDNVVGLWTSFADVSWDDFAVYDYDHTAKVELIYKVCRSCPNRARAVTRGASAASSTATCRARPRREGQVHHGRLLHHKPCTTTNYCMPTPMPPTTPAPPTTPPPPTPHRRRRRRPPRRALCRTRRRAPTRAAS
jgi:hypothetical protein